MNEHQQIALDHPCSHDGESVKAEYTYRRNNFALKTIVNEGFESYSRGGPIWHVTAVAVDPLRPSSRKVRQEDTERFLRSVAFFALLGVGDAHAGEWEEWDGYAYHLRRRLSADEQGYIEKRATEGAAMRAEESEWQASVQW